MSPAAYPLRPPWPPPVDLAPEVVPPPMDDRGPFVADAVGRFGDDEVFAGARWDAARRLMLDGDICGSLVPGECPGEPSCFSGDIDRSAAECRSLVAWLLTPREAFLPPGDVHLAYAPHAFPIGHGQTISAPYMVARMTAALNPGSGVSVLEVGTGSGYQAAMLAALSGRVFTIETVGPLASLAGDKLERLSIRRPWLETVRRRTGNGYEGWDEGAPFGRIIVTCAIDHVPPALMEQCAPGGMIILPLGEPRVQQLLAFRRRTTGESGPAGRAWAEVDIPDAPAGSTWDVRDVYGDGTRVVFVPFVH